MAEEDGEAPVKPAGKSNKMILVVVLMNVLGLGGLGAYLVLAKPVQHRPEPIRPKVGPLVELPAMIVNLRDPDAARYLKIAIQFELKNELARPAVEGSLVPIRSGVNAFFASVPVEATLGFANHEKLERGVLHVANQAVGHDVIKRVYFTDFVVQ